MLHSVTMVEDLWYKNAVMYSLDLETFMDMNGDGIGDFEGLTRRLDYLHSLGIDMLWLAPFQVTPNHDNGYDISDYYGVDPRHGSLGNFVEFMHQANKRGIRVIIDLVVNHTSDQHPWFKKAVDKDSPFRDWYVWSEKRPSDWNEGMVFPGVQKETWTYHKKAKAYYHHRFYDFQPDLNIDNEKVREEIRRIMGFWLQLGISGFRIDAVPFILETQTPGDKKKNIRFEYLREMRRFLQWRTGDAIMLGEANVDPKENHKYFGDEGNGIHMMFNFYVNQYTFLALATGDLKPLRKALEETRISYPTAQWANFLRNHDELDLARLTDDQRQKVFDRFGPDKTMQLYERGIRRRLSPMLGNRPQTELAYSFIFSLPGVPVIRYGDEIGMGENLDLKEREAVRTPMQWSSEKNAGYSISDKTIHPVVSEGPYAYQHVNVEMQQRTKDSLLNWMTALIRLRQECVEIGFGDWEIVDTDDEKVLCMCYTWKASSLLTIHNFAERTTEVVIRIKNKANSKLVDLFNPYETVADEKGNFRITLNAYGYRWFRGDNLSHSFSTSQ